jgi:hypothetical protein
VGTHNVETVLILKELVKVVAQRGVFWKGGKELINLWYYTVEALYGVVFTEKLIWHPEGKSVFEILEKIRVTVWGKEKTDQGGNERLDDL